MQTHLDDFRRHFSSLSDTGLLEVNREDLADAAKVCFDEEIASRGLDKESNSDDNIDEARDSGPELVTIAKFDRQDEAELARGLLDTNGITSYLSNDATFPGKKFGPVSCLELMVAPDLAEDASLILDTPISDEELAAQAEAEAEPL